MLQRHHRTGSERKGTWPGLVLCTLATLCGWGVTMWVGDGVLAGTVEFMGGGDGIPVWPRTLLGIAMLPWLLRMLLAAAPRDDNEAYRIFIRTSIIGLMLALTVIVLTQTVDASTLRETVAGFSAGFNAGLEGSQERVVPVHRSAGGMPVSVASLAAVMIGVGLTLMAEGMMAIVRYRANRVWRAFAWIYAGLILAAFIGAQAFPLDVLGTEFQIGFVPVIMVFVAVGSALPLAFRTGWMTNLRRPRKVAIALAAVPLFSGVLLVVGSVDDPLFITGYSAAIMPGLLTSLIGLSLALLVFSVIAFIASLFALPSAGAIDRRNDEMGWLARFSGLLLRSLDEGSFVETALTTARDSTGAMAAWFVMKREGETELVTGSSAGVPNVLLERVMEARDDHGAALRQSVLGLSSPLVLVDPAPGVGAVAAVPLVQGEETIGALLAAHRDRHGFDRESLLVLRALADQVALVRQHSELVRRSIEQERMEGEMEVARDMQARLLPREMPESPFYQLSAISQPARIVGGDYYDVVSFADRTMGLVIADVAGKGPGAALYMGMVKGIVQGLSGECHDAAELLRRANVALHGAIDGRWFVTMTCVQVVDHLYRVRVARAGHCATLVVRSGKAEWVRSRGMGLAIARPDLFNTTLDLVELDFAPGDALVLVSDGLPEARSEGGEEFGDDRLAETVRNVMEDHAGAEGVRDAILSAVRTFTADAEQHDDSTLVVLRWRGGHDLPTTRPAHAGADRSGAPLLTSSTSP